MSGKRVFFVAGEPSGDMHGATLVSEMKRLLPDFEAEGLGGQAMAQAGMALHFDLAGMAIMGFTEVARKLLLLKRIFRRTVAMLEQNRPDLLVLIDYPDFNLRLAKRAKTLGIPVIYFISPQVWAWRGGRVNLISKLVEKMIVILPFEEDIYRNAGVDVAFVGHPLVDRLAGYEMDHEVVSALDKDESGPRIGLLPGSRVQEIERMLPIMLGSARILAKTYPAARFLVACRDDETAEYIRSCLDAGKVRVPVQVVSGRTYEVISSCDVCLVASGTATLETAWFGTPMVIVYKVSLVSGLIASVLIHVRTIGLANIMAGKEIVPEFVQSNARADGIARAVDRLIDGPAARDTMVAELKLVREKMGEPGASRRAAEIIVSMLDAPVPETVVAA
jgi:lipid-A-disaccharide synthase